MNCYYCERDLTATGGTRRTKDHIVPITRGGVNHKVNLVLCCNDCNALKGGMTLNQFIRKVEKAFKRGRKVVTYTESQLKKIVKNARSLIENCINVYEKQLFIDKYHWEDYKDATKINHQIKNR